MSIEPKYGWDVIDDNYKMCVHIARKQELISESKTHYAKEVCADCGKFFKWIPRPIETINQVKLIARISKTPIKILVDEKEGLEFSLFVPMGTRNKGEWVICHTVNENCLNAMKMAVSGEMFEIRGELKVRNRRMEVNILYMERI